MTPEKWKDIKSRVRDTFEVIDNQTVNLSDRPGTMEFLEFNGPMGKMRLEWTDQPLLLDKKTHGSKRIGSETKVEYIYSDTERVNRFRAFQWNGDENSWSEMNMEKGMFTF